MEGEHEPNTRIEARAYTCYDRNRVVHYSGSPKSAFTVQDFTCTDGRVAKWIQGRSLVASNTLLVCNQLLHTDDVIQCSIQGALCTLIWFAMASDQLTVGSLHSKAALSFVGKSVLVLSNEQARNFLRLLGRPDQATELHATVVKPRKKVVRWKSDQATELRTTMVKASKKVVRWKSCVSSVIPVSKEASRKRPLAANTSIQSNLNEIPAVKMDTKKKSLMPSRVNLNTVSFC
jgi:hypothetical protein